MLRTRLGRNKPVPDFAPGQRSVSLGPGVKSSAMAVPGEAPDDVVQFGTGRPARRRWVSSVLLACLILAAIASVIVKGVDHGARPVAPAPVGPPLGVYRMLGPHRCPFSVTRDSTSTVGAPVVFHIACASLEPGTR